MTLGLARHLCALEQGRISTPYPSRYASVRRKSVLAFIAHIGYYAGSPGQFARSKECRLAKAVSIGTKPDCPASPSHRATPDLDAHQSALRRDLGIRGLGRVTGTIRSVCEDGTSQGELLAVFWARGRP